MHQIIELAGRRVFLCGTGWPVLASGRDAGDLMAAAWGERADAVALPAACLAPEFFRLASGLAGEVTQKFVNYKLYFAVLGDISAWTAQSQALNDYVVESNRGKAIGFARDLEALAALLGS